nr:wall-associated receptor kinase-like 20 [Ipomoea batatas]
MDYDEGDEDFDEHPLQQQEGDRGAEAGVLCCHLPECPSTLRGGNSCCLYYPKAGESLRLMLRYCGSYIGVRIGNHTQNSHIKWIDELWELHMPGNPFKNVGIAGNGEIILIVGEPCSDADTLLQVAGQDFVGEGNQIAERVDLIVASPKIINEKTIMPLHFTIETEIFNGRTTARKTERTQNSPPQRLQLANSSVSSSSRPPAHNRSQQQNRELRVSAPERIAIPGSANRRGEAFGANARPR